MKNILILGAGGQLGRELSLLFPEATAVYHHKEGSLNLNIENEKSLVDIIDKKKPEIIINAAALANVDLCEKDNSLAYNINGDSLRVITRQARKYNSLLIHISTDYVFDGKTGNYSENSIPNPINYYGLSKLIGDIYTSGYERSMIIRTSGVFGYTNNFPKFVIKTLSEGNQVNAIRGYYSPIHAHNLALAISELINKNYKGIINIAGDRISRYDLALKISDMFNFDKNLIKDVESSPVMVAHRPFDSSLNISLGRKILNFDFHSSYANLKLLKAD
ncbi:MAG: SDR family oxidoreductase [Thermoplasmataceae archaeon]